MKKKGQGKAGTAAVVLLVVVLFAAITAGIWYVSRKPSRLPADQPAPQAESKPESSMERTGYHDYAKDTAVIKDETGATVTPSNSIYYAILKKYGYDWEILQKYDSRDLLAGDSPNYEIIEPDTSGTIGKYTQPLTYTMAMVKWYLYPENSDTLENNLKNFLQQLEQERDERSDRATDTVPELYETLHGLSIMNGNNESEETYYSNARAKTIQVTVNGSSVYTFELEDTNEAQLFDLNYKQTDIGVPIYVEIEVLETYPGDASNDVYLNEISFGLSQNGFGGI